MALFKRRTFINAGNNSGDIMAAHAVFCIVYPDHLHTQFSFLNMKKASVQTRTEASPISLMKRLLSKNGG
jgi:hypothetical protein